MVKRSKPGICFGFSIKKNTDTHKYSAKIYMNDKNTVRMKFANGLPNQENEVWTPFRQQPDMNSFEWY